MSLGSLVGLACSEMALGQCFHFGFRVVKIMKTFETYLETRFSNRIQFRHRPTKLPWDTSNRFQLSSGDSRIMALRSGWKCYYTCPSTIPDRFQVSPGITSATKTCFHVVSILSQFCLMFPKSRINELLKKICEKYV